MSPSNHQLDSLTDAQAIELLQAHLLRLRRLAGLDDKGVPLTGLRRVADIICSPAGIMLIAELEILPFLPRKTRHTIARNL